MLLKTLCVIALVSSLAVTGIEGMTYREANQKLLNFYDTRNIVYHEDVPQSSAFKRDGLDDFSITNCITGDGNCQFRAVSLLAYGHQDYHGWLREETIKHLELNKDFYKTYVEGNFEDYLTDMSQDGAWGDNVTLMAMASDLHREFVILKENPSSGEVHIFTQGNEQKGSGTGFLSLTNDHYEVVFKAS